jgi:hypothetical protein
MLARWRFGMSSGIHRTRSGGARPKCGLRNREFRGQTALRESPAPQQAFVPGGIELVARLVSYRRQSTKDHEAVRNSRINGVDTGCVASMPGRCQRSPDVLT